MSISIEKSVGIGGHNNPIDVAVIQHLISKYFTQRHKVKGRSTTSIKPSIPIDGVCTHDLIDLIKKIQATALVMKSPDGRVDPNGRTFRELILQTNPAAATAKELLFGREHRALHQN